MKVTPPHPARSYPEAFVSRCFFFEPAEEHLRQERACAGPQQPLTDLVMFPPGGWGGWGSRGGKGWGGGGSIHVLVKRTAVLLWGVATSWGAQAFWDVAVTWQGGFQGQ